MNILFRIDAGDEIGLGHFYRSLNLAKALQERGHNIYIAHQASTFWSLSNFSFKHSTINSELDQLTLISLFNISTYYVDSILEISEYFYKKLKENNIKVVFYQNLSKSKHLCDYFILPSIHQEKYFFQTFSSNTKIYQGLEYFTFNEKLKNISKKREVKKKIKNIAIVTGGSDPKNILGKLFLLLKKFDKNDIDYNYFYGNNFLHLKEIPKKIDKHKFSPFELEEIVKNDLVITSFGVSAYELMVLGLPVIGVGHQKSNADACDFLADKGYMFSLGNIDELEEKFFFQKISLILKDFELRKNVVSQASSKLDLKGIDRIINIIENE